MQTAIKISNADRYCMDSLPVYQSALNCSPGAWDKHNAVTNEKKEIQPKQT